MASAPIPPRVARRGDVSRRALLLIAGTLLLAAPAAALTIACAGRSCDAPDEQSTRTPFCTLPKDLRDRLVAGYYDGRSPEVLGVISAGVAVSGRSGPWPSADARSTGTITVWGRGVEAGAMPESLRLDAVAPTLERIAGIRRPHPEVRSGVAAEVASGGKPRLLLLVALEGGAEIPYLRILANAGAGTARIDSGSLPADRTALLTTIATGGLPRQHGITGRLIRDEDGNLLRSWSPTAPPPVIAALGDDLDEITNQDALVGFVGATRNDRVIAGGTWYIERDRDDLAIARRPSEAADRVVALLRDGYGRDEIVDLLSVTLSGRPKSMDAALHTIVAKARRASDESVAVAVVTLTRPTISEPVLDETQIVDHVEADVGAPVVESPAAGGLFLDQAVLGKERLTSQDVTIALRSMRVEGRPVFEDVFPSITVTLSRYC